VELWPCPSATCEWNRTWKENKSAHMYRAEKGRKSGISCRWGGGHRVAGVSASISPRLDPSVACCSVQGPLLCQQSLTSCLGLGSSQELLGGWEVTGVWNVCLVDLLRQCCPELLLWCLFAYILKKEDTRTIAWMTMDTLNIHLGDRGCIAGVSWLTLT